VIYRKNLVRRLLLRGSQFYMLRLANVYSFNPCTLIHSDTFSNHDNSVVTSCSDSWRSMGHLSSRPTGRNNPVDSASVQRDFTTSSGTEVLVCITPTPHQGRIDRLLGHGLGWIAEAESDVAPTQVHVER
jgi:hypothetical protein